jgi:hypothetical protein
VSNGELLWNPNIGGFTHTYPFDPSNGTFADSANSFPNSFSSGGTFGMRFRLDRSVETALGQASLVGLVTFRPEPDPNVHSTPPRSLELYRGGPTDPLVLLAREGHNTTGYQNQFNDYVESSPLNDVSGADITAVVVWTPQTLRVYVAGVLAGEKARVTADHPTSHYRLYVAVNQFVVHSGDLQFFKGATRRLVVYNRALDGAEVLALDAALNGDVVSARPAAPKNVRIVAD